MLSVVQRFAPLYEAGGWEAFFDMEARSGSSAER
jgi:hypothetical protein